MMSKHLKPVFAAAALLGGMTMAQPASALDARKSDVACVTLTPDGRVRGDDRGMASYIHEALKSATGRDLFADVAADRTRICMDFLMPYASPDGVSIIGNYTHSKNRIMLSPWYQAAALVPCVVHEARHKRQYAIGLDKLRGGNYPETDRMAMSWLLEADARLAAVIFAWEMEKSGDARYADHMRAHADYGPLYKSFSDSLSRDPGNVPDAMGAVIRSFRDNRAIADIYDRNMAAYIVDRKKIFKPARKERDMLDDATLRRIGDWRGYGNYMTPELMDYIRSSVSEADYIRARDYRPGGFRRGATVFGV